MNMEEIIKQGQAQSGAMIKGGQLLIDIEPDRHRARIVLRNVEPEAAVPQLLEFLTTMLSMSAQMMSLEPRLRSRESTEQEGQ